MAVDGDAPTDLKRETCPRPGHADLVGMLKIASDDARDILERSSARETAARVAAGGIAKALLAELGVEVYSYVRRIGSVELPKDVSAERAAIEASECRCPDETTTRAMKELIDDARAKGESLGGEFVVIAEGLVPGLGSYASGSRPPDFPSGCHGVFDSRHQGRGVRAWLRGGATSGQSRA